jgi:two-component system response regulator (stage 0 sporulation protein A)
MNGKVKIMDQPEILSIFFEGEPQALRIASEPQLADIVVKKNGEITVSRDTTKSILQQAVNVEITKDSRKKNVTNVIQRFGVPAHIKGYVYVREAITLAVEDLDIVNSITKILYPTVARTYKTTSSRVERAIRHAIEVGYERNEDVFNVYFPSSSRSKRPTNSEFVAQLADMIKLEEENI